MIATPLPTCWTFAPFSSDIGARPTRGRCAHERVAWIFDHIHEFAFFNEHVDRANDGIVGNLVGISSSGGSTWHGRDGTDAETEQSATESRCPSELRRCSVGP